MPEYSKTRSSSNNNSNSNANNSSNNKNNSSVSNGRHKKSKGNAGVNGAGVGVQALGGDKSPLSSHGMNKGNGNNNNTNNKNNSNTRMTYGAQKRHHPQPMMLQQTKEASGAAVDSARGQSNSRNSEPSAAKLSVDSPIFEPRAAASEIGRNLHHHGRRRHHRQQQQQQQQQQQHHNIATLTSLPGTPGSGTMSPMTPVHGSPVLGASGANLSKLQLQLQQQQPHEQVGPFLSPQEQVKRALNATSAVERKSKQTSSNVDNSNNYLEQQKTVNRALTPRPRDKRQAAHQINNSNNRLDAVAASTSGSFMEDESIVRLLRAEHELNELVKTVREKLSGKLNIEFLMEEYARIVAMFRQFYAQTTSVSADTLSNEAELATALEPISTLFGTMLLRIQNFFLVFDFVNKLLHDLLQYKQRCADERQIKEQEVAKMLKEAAHKLEAMQRAESDRQSILDAVRQSDSISNNQNITWEFNDPRYCRLYENSLVARSKKDTAKSPPSGSSNNSNSSVSSFFHNRSSKLLQLTTHPHISANIW